MPVLENMGGISFLTSWFLNDTNNVGGLFFSLS